MTSFDIVMTHVGAGQDAAQRLHFDLKPGQELVFGRAPSVDITIPDPDRKVSSRHGKIRCDQNGQLFALDLGSLNGTYLEGTALAQGDGTAVTFGNQLRVGDFELEIAPAAQFETLQTKDVGAATEALMQSLEDAYDANIDADSNARAAAMQFAADQATTPKPPHVSSAMLMQVLERTSGMGGSRSGPALPAPALSTPPYGGPTPANQEPTGTSTTGGAADEMVRKLAAQLVPDSQLETDADFEVFGELLQQVCVATLDWLAKGLQSRGVFAQEFGAEVTLVFQRSQNPLKAMSLDELREYLLDWRGDTDAATRSYYLEGVLKDLTEHQVAVIAGVKEAISGIFTRLSPERISAVADKASGWSKSAKAWAAYQQIHKELAEEQTKLFNEMVTPAIQKGYLHKHDE